MSFLSPEILWFGQAGSRQPANPEMQSDRPIVVMKPGNAGGVKGTTS
jgi:hypothetical protein